jgi:HEPN domain-containing protein
LAAARFASEKGFLCVFVDNLFSATELMAKGLLIWLPDRSLLDSKTHRSIKVRFNALRKHDNVDGRFVELLNRLTQLRERARYLSGEVALTEGEMDAMLAIAEEMCEALVKSTPRRARIDGTAG